MEVYQRHVTGESIDCFNTLADQAILVAETAMVIVVVLLALSLLLVLIVEGVFD